MENINKFNLIDSYIGLKQLENNFFEKINKNLKIEENYYNLIDIFGNFFEYINSIEKPIKKENDDIKKELNINIRIFYNIYDNKFKDIDIEKIKKSYKNILDILENIAKNNKFQLDFSSLSNLS